MISVTVQRSPADRQGPDISDPLITSDGVARERGRNEIDANSTNRELVSGSGPMGDFMRPGRLVEVMDAEQAAWRGRLNKVAYTMQRSGDSISMLTATVIEREA